MSKVNHRANSVLALLVEETNRSTRRNEEKARRRDKAVPARTKLVRYQFNPNAQNAPKPGESVAIRHRSEEQENGQVKLVRSGIDARVIKRLYMSDADGYLIQDNCGEQWLVRPSSVGGSKWETFLPNEGRKERV